MHTQNEEMANHLDLGQLNLAQSPIQVAALELLKRGSMTDGDVAHLRAEPCADGITNKEDAEALFALDRSGLAACSAWTGFFVDAITDYLVWQNRPTGIISEEQAEWLIAQTDEAKSISALAALVNILAEADRVPHWLPAAARGRIAAGWPGVDEALEEAQRGARLAA